VTFRPGSATAPFSLATVNDTLDEENSTVTVQLQDGNDYSLGDPSEATVVVEDNDPLITATLSPATQRVVEGETATVTVRLEADGEVPDGGNSIYKTQDDTAIGGEDYEAQQGLASALASDFADQGDGTYVATRTFTIETLDDNEVEGEERFTFVLPGLTALAEIIITDNDEALPVVSIVSDQSSVTEGSSAAFTLTRVGDASGALTVSLDVGEDGDVVAASDEGARTASFEAGSSTTTFRVATVGDEMDEENSTVTVRLQADAAYTIGDPSEATVVVEDDDPIMVVSIDPSQGTVTERAGETIRLLVRLSQYFPVGTPEEQRTFPVAYTGSAVAGDDYEQIDHIVFPEEELDVRLVIPLVDDLLQEPAETVTVAIGTITQELSILDNDAAPELDLSLSEGSVSEGSGTGVLLTVSTGTGSRFAEDQMIQLTLGGDADLGSDYTVTDPDGGVVSASPFQVTLPAGARDASVTLTPVDDDLVEDEESVVISGSLLGSEEQFVSTPTLIITDNDEAPEPAEPDTDLPAVSVSADQPEVTEGSAAVFTLTRTGDASEALEVSVDVTEDGDAVAASDEGAQTATFGAGSTTATFRVVTVNDELDEENSTVTVQVQTDAVYTIGDPSEATVVVADDDETPASSLPAVTISAVSAEVPEGGAATFELTRAGDLTEELRVLIGVSDPDLVLVSAVPEAVVFAPGSSTERLVLGTGDDGLAGLVNGRFSRSGSRIRVAVLESAGSYELGRRVSATVVIVDAGGASVLAKGRRLGAASLLRRHVQRFSQLSSDMALGRLERRRDGSTLDIRASEAGVTVDGDLTFELRSGWEGWGSLRYSRLSGSAEGAVWDFYAGADYRSADGRMVYGALIGYEPGRVTSDGVELEARYIQVGLYGARRLSETLTLDGALGWGRGRNDLSLVESAYPVTASYRSDRFVVRSDLTGDFGWGGGSLRVAPQIGILYAQERLGSFTDSVGGVAGGDQLWLARIGFGPQLTWSLPKSTTHARLRVNMDAHNLEASGERREEISAAFELGHQWRFTEDSSLDLSASFDGLGAGWFSSNTLGLQYQLNF